MLKSVIVNVGKKDYSIEYESNVDTAAHVISVIKSESQANPDWIDDCMSEYNIVSASKHFCRSCKSCKSTGAQFHFTCFNKPVAMNEETDCPYFE